MNVSPNLPLITLNAAGRVDSFFAQDLAHNVRNDIATRESFGGEPDVHLFGSSRIPEHRKVVEAGACEDEKMPDEMEEGFVFYQIKRNP